MKRLVQEQKLIKQSPPEFIRATPDEHNILLWYYVIDGPQDTPYEGGKYIGKVKFPPDYPFAPPSIMMTTPNGRFKTETRLCLSISDFHPKEWNPVWNASTILTGLLSFMVGSDQTHGSMETSTSYKRELATKSHRFNLQLPFYEKLFPEDFAVSKEICAKEDAQLQCKKTTGTSSSASGSCDEKRSHADPNSGGPWREMALKAVQGVMMVSIGALCYYVLITPTGGD